jgi:hypothetical protein
MRGLRAHFFIQSAVFNPPRYLLSHLSSISVPPSVVRDAFYHGGFGTLPESLLSSEDIVRNSLVIEIDHLCNDGRDVIEGLGDAVLAEAAVAGQILLRSGLKNATTLSTMSLEDQRNTLIVANVDYYQEGVAYYQSLSTLENSRLGYQWYLTKSLANFMGPFQQVTSSETSVYNLRATDTNLGMDCLSVRKIGVSMPNFRPSNAPHPCFIYLAMEILRLYLPILGGIFRSVPQFERK